MQNQELLSYRKESIFQLQVVIERKDVFYNLTEYSSEEILVRTVKRETQIRR